MTNKELYYKSLDNISPIDGRRCCETEELKQYFSESALHKYRIKVEIEHLKKLSETLPNFPKVDMSKINNCFKYENFFLLDDNYFSLDQIIEILKKEYNYTDKQINKLKEGYKHV